MTLKTDQKDVYAYKREKGDAGVVVLLNLSKKPLTVKLKDDADGSYTELVHRRSI